MMSISSILLSGSPYGSRSMPVWLVSCLCIDLNAVQTNPFQDYSGSGKPCTQSNFNEFFHTAQSFLEGASYVEMYAMFGKSVYQDQRKWITDTLCRDVPCG